MILGVVGCSCGAELGVGRLGGIYLAGVSFSRAIVFKTKLYLFFIFRHMRHGYPSASLARPRSVPHRPRPSRHHVARPGPPRGRLRGCLSNPTPHAQPPPVPCSAHGIMEPPLPCSRMISSLTHPREAAPRRGPKADHRLGELRLDPQKQPRPAQTAPPAPFHQKDHQHPQHKLHQRRLRSDANTRSTGLTEPRSAKQKHARGAVSIPANATPHRKYHQTLPSTNAAPAPCNATLTPEPAARPIAALAAIESRPASGLLRGLLLAMLLLLDKLGRAALDEIARDVHLRAGRAARLANLLASPRPPSTRGAIPIISDSVMPKRNLTQSRPTLHRDGLRPLQARHSKDSVRVPLLLAPPRP